MTFQPLSYRPDIDGLRAVAVLLVVGRHIGAPWMPGGFTGVDIFFVISGYLITCQLVREQMDRGRIDLAAYYARRVRRLLPALGVVMAVTLLLAFAVLLPDEQTALAHSALASLAFVANFYDAGLSQIAAGRPDVRIWSPLDALCPGGRCPAVIGGRLLYRNRAHLTIDGSAWLAPAMMPWLGWLADAPPKR